MRVAYFSNDTGRVHTIIDASTLDGMPEATVGNLAVITDYVGELPAMWDGSSVVGIPVKPSPTSEWDWGTKSWSFSQEQAYVFSKSALDAIDKEAGNTRVKYITSVPGQSETYQRKEQQAREWSALGFSGQAPSFIQAEADALNVSPETIAQQVIQLADYWSNVKGPQIEACRRKWKVAIDAAGTDFVAISTARDSGIAELKTL